MNRYEGNARFMMFLLGIVGIAGLLVAVMVFAPQATETNTAAIKYAPAADVTPIPTIGITENFPNLVGLLKVGQEQTANGIYVKFVSYDSTTNTGTLQIGPTGMVGEQYILLDGQITVDSVRVILRNVNEPSLEIWTK